MTVYTAHETDEVYTDERCFILELLGSSDDALVSIARARVEPGVTTALHRLNGVAERYVIQSGSGLVEVNGKRSPVQPGNVVAIPAGCPQRITNTGGEDLVFLCICTPPFVADCYEDLEV
jgi:mannose-6-phosphate isomerase-like protein (cupin superfamily)